MSPLAPLRLSESAQTAALSVTHAPIGKGGTNWITKSAPGNTGQLPAYIQNVRNAIMRHLPDESRATAIAIGRVRDWAEGKGKVGPEVKAAAAKAIAEFDAKRAGAKAKSAVKESVSLAERVALRTGARGCLDVLVEAVGADGVRGLLEASAGSFSPELKRVASAQSEKERLEVHHDGQHVGTVASRQSYRPGESDRWSAKGVNGRMVGEACSSKAEALGMLKKHLEDAPGRISPSPTAGRFLVGEPQGYSGPTTFKEFPSESAARYEAGLPEKKTRPELDAQVAALGEMVAFDLVTLTALGESVPGGLGPLVEAGFERVFDEAKHPRGPGGKFKVGDRVNMQHSYFGRVPGKVTKVTSRRVHVSSSDPRVRDSSMTHLQAEKALSHTGGTPSGRMEDKVMVGGLPTTRGEAWQQAHDAAKAKGHPDPRASADRFMQGLDHSKVKRLPK